MWVVVRSPCTVVAVPASDLGALLVRRGSLCGRLGQKSGTGRRPILLFYIRVYLKSNVTAEGGAREDRECWFYASCSSDWIACLEVILRALPLCNV